jgi:hypothetical protein
VAPPTSSSTAPISYTVCHGLVDSNGFKLIIMLGPKLPPIAYIIIIVTASSDGQDESGSGHGREG